jgi:hypothetical protein
LKQKLACAESSLLQFAQALPEGLELAAAHGGEGMRFLKTQSAFCRTDGKRGTISACWCANQ